MKSLFFAGGSLFMGILTVLLIAMTAWMIYHFIMVYSSKQTNLEQVLSKLSYGKSIGLFAMITGILGQLVGFYAAFSAIETAVDISPALVYGGIKVSLITPIYGILIYLFSLLLWFVASIIIENKNKI